MRLTPPSLLFLLALAPLNSLDAQPVQGRVFGPTPETVAIWEFNEFPGLADGDAVPEGTLIPDLTGTGHDATVESNAAGDLRVGAGDGSFDNPAGSNREGQRTGFGNPGMRVVVNDDNGDFEMATTDDFSVELYINRENIDDPTNWGILAGTWHSRNVLDDGAAPDDNGAWYGYGLIRNDKNSNPPYEWSWVLSPVVDGIPRIGFGQAPEQHLQPFFDIPEGRHYVVLTVNRTEQIAVGYVDGVEVTRSSLPEDWSFTTPDGYEHARFMMFAGEDDPTRGSFRGSPPGTHIDAARVQRRYLLPEEVTEIWDNILSGVTSPPITGCPRATLLASGTSVIVNQCVRLNAEASVPCEGKPITKYEWRIGDGAFEVGDATREVSFAAVDAVGVRVTVRITDSAGATAQASTSIRVREPAIAARIVASVAGVPLPGATIFVQRGSVVTLDGTQSSTTIPANAFQCPIGNAVPVDPSPVSSYRWDLDGKLLTAESTAPSFDTPPYNTLGEFPVNLQVRSASGASALTGIKIKVVDGGRTTRVFCPTAETVCLFELNGLDDIIDGAALPVGQQIDDLSGNDHHAIVEGNEGGDLVMVPGSPVYETLAESNRAVGRSVFTGHQPRLAINDDADQFEMGPEDNFTIELFVDRETVTGSANWGILAGTWHSRNLLDDGVGVPENDGAWYGYGLIRNDKDANPPAEWSWVLSPVVDGIPRIGFNQAPEQHLQPFFNIPEGRHYVVLSMDRTIATAVGYVDGVAVTRRENIPPEWSFTTPEGYEHARFLMFTGEDDPTRGAFRGSPAGTGLDAVRVQRVALTPDEVVANWESICAGDGAQSDQCKPIEPPQKQFHRGDADNNAQLQLTDAVRILGFLFLGQASPTCMDAADADDNGILQLTDAVRILGFLFLGQAPPSPPGPPDGVAPCGADPTPGDAGEDIGCETYTSCQ